MIESLKHLFGICGDVQHPPTLILLIFIYLLITKFKKWRREIS